jgi:hypothetical protein
VLCAVGYVAATGGGAQGVPRIEAPAGAVKVKPDNPGGLQVNTQTSSLLKIHGSAADADLAPAPEVPDPAALAAAANEEQGPPAVALASVPTVGPVPATVAQMTPPAVPPTVSVPTVPETPTSSAPQQTAMNLPRLSAGTAAVHNLAQEYSPPARPAERGNVRVQLAALGSQEAALRQWEHLAHRMPALFDKRRPIFAEAHVNGHTFWRVRTAGFDSAADAARFCNDVRARGAACTVALF